MKKWVFDKRLGLLLFALMVGGIAAWGTRNYIQQQVESIEEKNRVEMATVVVAADNIPAGTLVQESSLAIREVPIQWIPQGAVGVSQVEGVLDKITTTNLQAGDTILMSHVQAPAQAIFSEKLPPGMRALSIGVDDLHAISGFIQPGDFIDLYVAFSYAGKNMTARLLENIRVLATGQEQRPMVDEEGEERSFSALTLQLSAEQAEKLIVARETAQLIPVLKSAQDKSVPSNKKLPPLANIVGVQLQIPTARKKVPVIYGDQAIGRIPSIKATDPALSEKEGGNPSEIQEMLESLQSLSSEE